MASCKLSRSWRCITKDMTGFCRALSVEPDLDDDFSADEINFAMAAEGFFSRDIPPSTQSELG